MKSLILRISGIAAAGCVLLLVGCERAEDTPATGTRNPEAQAPSPTPPIDEPNPSSNPGPAAAAANGEGPERGDEGTDGNSESSNP